MQVMVQVVQVMEAEMVIEMVVEMVQVMEMEMEWRKRVPLKAEHAGYGSPS